MVRAPKAKSPTWASGLNSFILLLSWPFFNFFGVLNPRKSSAFSDFPHFSHCHYLPANSIPILISINSELSSSPAHRQPEQISRFLPIHWFLMEIKYTGDRATAKINGFPISMTFSFFFLIFFCMERCGVNASVEIRNKWRTRSARIQWTGAHLIDFHPSNPSFSSQKKNSFIFYKIILIFWRARYGKWWKTTNSNDSILNKLIWIFNRSN